MSALVNVQKRFAQGDVGLRGALLRAGLIGGQREKQTPGAALRGERRRQPFQGFRSRRMIEPARQDRDSLLG